MWFVRLLKFTACAAPAAALAVAVPWWLLEPLRAPGVDQTAVWQACILLGATILMIGCAVGWHVAGLPLIAPSDSVPPVLRKHKYPAAVVILLLVGLAWGMATVTATGDIVEAIADWGLVGQIVAAALVAFVLSVIGLALQLVSREQVTREDISESTPVGLKIVAALLLGVAGYVQRLGQHIAEKIERWRGA